MPKKSGKKNTKKAKPTKVDKVDNKTKPKLTHRHKAKHTYHKNPLDRVFKTLCNEADLKHPKRDILPVLSQMYEHLFDSIMTHVRVINGPEKNTLTKTQMSRGIINYLVQSNAGDDLIAKVQEELAMISGEA